MSIVIQIFSMVSISDALALAELGVDHIGFMVSRSSERIEYTITPEIGRDICLSIHGQAKCVMLPISHNPRVVAEWIDFVEPDIVQIASYEEYLPFDRYLEIYSYARSHGVKVTRVIPIGCGCEWVYVDRYRRYADILMLDTYGDPPSTRLRGFIGGTGKTHDWFLSREISKSIDLPIILAGGLDPYNVADAIEIVKPWGVDAATKLDLPGSGGRKDLDRVRLFIYRVKELR